MRIFDNLTTFFILITGTLSFTIAQEHIPSEDELLQTIPGLSNIPGFAEFNTSSVKTEDFKKLLREKCEKNGGSTAFDGAKQAPVFLSTCLQSLVNIMELRTEIEEARPRGELDTVFEKYCHRVPKLEKCVKNLTDVIEPCLDLEERESVKIIHHITSSLLTFICHNEGNRLAMFIAAGGIECFESKGQAVLNCGNEIFSSYVPAAISAALMSYSIPSFVLGVKECTDIEKFKNCTVEVLEECRDPTPVNVVESLLNFVKKVTPCENLLKAQASMVTGNVEGKNGPHGTTSGVSDIPESTDHYTLGVKTMKLGELFREKCERNGGPTAYHAAKQGPVFFSNCLQSLVNMTELQTEIEEARPRGELDTVFKKYCQRVPNLQNCVKNLTDVIEPCLDLEEHESVKIIHHITSSLLTFICHNEGDRLAMFIAADGLECLASKQHAIAACVTEISSTYYNPTANTAGYPVPEVTSIPRFVLTPEDCTDSEQFKTCAVKVLEECDDPTPANVVEAMFNLVRKITPCDDMLRQTTERRPHTGAKHIETKLDNSIVNFGNSNQMIMEKICKKDAQGVPMTYDDLKSKLKIFDDYITSLGDMTQIVTDIVTAIPQGNLDSVLRKKCAKASSLRVYLGEITSNIAYCVEPKHRNKVRSIYNLTNLILKFVCNDRC